MTIQGSGFDTNTANDSVILDNGVIGTVTSASGFSLTVSLTGLSNVPVGTVLQASVTVDGMSSGSVEPVATVAAAAAVPVVAASSTSVPDSSTTITINGSGFSTTQLSNTVDFNLGVQGYVTQATPNQLVVAIVTPPTALGSLFAQVTSSGVSSGMPVLVATEVSGDWIVTDAGGSGGSLTDVTLPYAVANALNGDQITFASNLNGDTITLGSTLNIGTSITITAGANLTLSSHHTALIIDVGPEAIASISNLTVENGQGTSGGGIYNAGTLTLSNDTISGNSGIYSSGMLTLTDDFVSGNPAAGVGSGIVSAGNNALTISASAFTYISDNIVCQGGGGLTLAGSGTIMITGNINLGTGNLTNANYGQATLSGVISGGAGSGTLLVPGLIGTYFNLTAAPDLIQPAAPSNPAWLGNQTPAVTAQLVGPIDFPDIADNGFADSVGDQAYYNLGNGNNNNVEARWYGEIMIPGTGTTPVPINFATTSDDGSMLYIDGNAVVSNNNFQGATQQTGLVFLTPGLHYIDIEYYQGGGTGSMDAQWDPAGGTNFVDIPNSAFFSSQSVNGLTMTGDGTLVLPNTNTYLGATTIDAGTLIVSADGAMGPAAAAGVFVNPGGALAFNGGVDYATAESVTISGSGPFGNGAIESISGTNAFAGPITVSGDAVIGADAGTLTLTGTIDLGQSGNLTVTGSGPITISGTISGAATSASVLTVAGTSQTLTLSGNNTYGGVTAIDSGDTLQVVNGGDGTTGSLGTGPVFNDGTLIIDLGSTVNVASAIFGTGTVALTSIDGAITQSAAITAATLIANASIGITLTSSGNAVDTFTANNSTSGSISLTNSAALTIYGIGISQAGTGTVTISNTGSLTLIGPVNSTGNGAISLTASGPDVSLDVNSDITSADGPLAIDATGDLIIGSGVTINSGTGALTLAADAEDNGIGTLSIDAGADVFGGKITLRGAAEDIDPTATIGSASANPGVPGTTQVTIQSSLESLPMRIGGTNNSGTAGIYLSAAELARIVTTPAGTITFGDSKQTGNITFIDVTPATTAGAATVALQAGSGPGQIILDDGSGSGTALNGNGGTVTLTAGTGGIVEQSTNTTGTPDIGNATTVTLTSGGAIGSSADPLQVAAANLLTDTSATNSDQYLAALTAFTSLNLTAGTGTIYLGTIEAAKILVTAGQISLGGDVTSPTGSVTLDGAVVLTADTTISASANVTFGRHRRWSLRPDGGFQRRDNHLCGRGGQHNASDQPHDDRRTEHCDHRRRRRHHRRSGLRGRHHLRRGDDPDRQ